MMSWFSVLVYFSQYKQLTSQSTYALFASRMHPDSTSVWQHLFTKTKQLRILLQCLCSVIIILSVPKNVLWVIIILVKRIINVQQSNNLKFKNYIFTPFMGVLKIWRHIHSKIFKIIFQATLTIFKNMSIKDFFL